MIPVAVLASGRGTNFEAIHAAIRSGMLKAEIVAVVTDRPGAPVLEKARALGVRTLTVKAPQGPDRRREVDQMIIELLSPYQPRFLIMAGFMRIVTSVLLDAYRSPQGYTRVTNIHPSLLPAFPGQDSYRQAYDYGACVAGVSVHLVEEAVDAGPICAQRSFSITDCASIEDVEARGLAIEHLLYPEALSWILPERFSITKHPGGRLRVRPS